MKGLLAGMADEDDAGEGIILPQSPTAAETVQNAAATDGFGHVVLVEDDRSRASARQDGGGRKMLLDDDEIRRKLRHLLRGKCQLAAPGGVDRLRIGRDVEIGKQRLVFAADDRRRLTIAACDDEVTDAEIDRGRIARPESHVPRHEY